MYDISWFKLKGLKCFNCKVSLESTLFRHNEALANLEQLTISCNKIDMSKFKNLKKLVLLHEVSSEIDCINLIEL